jgi:urease accessory protein
MRATAIIITATAAGMCMNMTDAASLHDVLRLAAWLSPSFPVGAYTYSSGLEYAVEVGIVTDAASLEEWIGGVVQLDTGRSDGGLFVLAYRAAQQSDIRELRNVLEWADALRATSELALESAGQGDAFLKIVRAAWPHPGLDAFYDIALEAERKPAYAVVVGAACGHHNVTLEPALAAFLHAVSANLVSAAVRSIPLGQTDGQRVTAAMELVIAEIVPNLLQVTLDDIGSATPMVDWASMQHETQYTRLFRS